MIYASFIMLWVIALRIATLHPHATKESSISVARFASVLTLIALFIAVVGLIDATLSAS